MLTVPTTFLKGTPSTPFTNTYSCLFDGVQDYVSMGNVLGAYLEYNVAWSVSFWMRGDAISGTDTLFSKQDQSVSFRGLNIYTSSSRIYVSLVNTWSANAIWSYGTTTLSNATWYNIVVTYDGSSDESGLKIYLNGSAETMNNLTNGLNATTNIGNLAPMLIGARDAGALPFDGNIDEVSLIASELSAADVTAIYGGGSPSSMSPYSPVGWWRMGDPGGTSEFPTITDVGSSGSNGTMTNMTSADIVAQVP